MEAPEGTAAVRQFGRGTEAEEHWLLVVVPRDALLLAERPAPFVDALLVDAVEFLVEDRLDDRAEVG